MALKIRFLFIIGVLLIIGFFSCDKSPSGSEPDPEEPELPQSIDITAPSASTTYWDDEPIACAVDDPDYADEAVWLVNGKAVACTDGELSSQLPAGEHTVTLRLADGDDQIEKNVTITVKESFTVSLDQPKDTEFFVGDQVQCSATVTPDTYRDALQITVGGIDCTGGTAEVTDSGELTARAWLTVDNRTEADERAVMAKPVVAGQVYPLTDQGVVGAAGFSVQLQAGGEVHDVETDASGRFSIRSDRFAELSDELVTLEVAASSDFYGARAEGLSADELQALVESESLGFILAPKTWQIRCGPFSGESTTIKLPEAFTRYERDDGLEHYASFYMLVPKRNGVHLYRRWDPADRPLLAAFDRERSEVAITAADSTAFWQETTKVEEKICRGDLLKPATKAEVPDPYDGVEIRSKEAGTVATGAASSSSSGYIVGGIMSLPIDKFGPSYGQRHELAQVFGFGETSEWVGVTSSGQFSGEHDFDHYSVDDVSHIQLYMDTVDLQAEKGLAFGVYAWRRVFDIPSLPDN